MSIEVGQKLPSASLQEGNPGNQVDPAQAFGSGKHVVFAVPGAFTPGCDKTHLPGYIADFQQIKDKGVDSIACVAVNDVFVMDAWGKAHDAAGKVRMLADPNAEFTKAVGLDVNAKALGGTRSWTALARHSRTSSFLRLTVVGCGREGVGGRGMKLGCAHYCRWGGVG